MQILINGLITGMTIGVLALAFSMVYLPTRVFFVALGGVYALVPFVAWTFVHLHCPWWLSAALAVSIGTGLSILCEVGNHASLSRMRAPSAVHLVSSLGIYIVVVQVVVLIWGPESRTLRQGIDSVIGLGHAQVTHSQATTAVVSLAMLVLVYLWLRLTRWGLYCRAMSDNPNELAIRGHSITQMRIVAYAGAGFLASTCSVTTAYDLGFGAHAGLSAILLAIVAVVVGGRTSFAGAAIGGLVLGIARSGMLWFTSAAWQDAMTFSLLAAFLFARPEGLLAAKHRLESDR